MAATDSLGVGRLFSVRRRFSVRRLSRRFSLGGQIT
jgi:hypothetical protein